MLLNAGGGLEVLQVLQLVRAVALVGKNQKKSGLFTSGGQINSLK